MMYCHECSSKAWQRVQDLLVIQGATVVAVVNLWLCMLTTWRFFLPQALDLAGSACFTLLLGAAPLSFVVPVTNAMSLCA